MPDVEERRVSTGNHYLTILDGEKRSGREREGGREGRERKKVWTLGQVTPHTQISSLQLTCVVVNAR